MTHEEKDLIIQDYCRLVDSDCEVCSIRDICDPICGDFISDESACDKALAIIRINDDPIKPNYYNDSKITPFNVIDDWDLNFYLGTAIKYIKRAGKKENNSKLQDLQKAQEYIKHEIEKEANND